VGDVFRSLRTNQNGGLNTRPIFRLGKDAVSFALFMGGVGLEIWLAEADVVEQKARAGFFQGWDYLYRVFWEHYDEKIGEPAPRGTVLCSTITIKERLAETVESSDGLITLQEMEPSR